MTINFENIQNGTYHSVLFVDSASRRLVFETLSCCIIFPCFLGKTCPQCLLYKNGLSIKMGCKGKLKTTDGGRGVGSKLLRNNILSKQRNSNATSYNIHAKESGARQQGLSNRLYLLERFSLQYRQ